MTKGVIAILCVTMEMMTENRIKRCTITVNRACNLRCRWCYAKDTAFSKKDDITIETFERIVNFCKEGNIESICLIGGEPTVYPNIFLLLDRLKGYKVSIVSNGILFENDKICRKYVEYGVRNFSISIKAANAHDYLETTGKNAFYNVIKAINNLMALGANVSVSYVITDDNVNSIKDFVTYIRTKTKCSKFFFSFCREYNEKIKNPDKNPLYLSKQFEELLPWLKENVPNLIYALNDPLCIYSDCFIKNNIKDFYFPCYVHTNSMIVFDTDGALIPCNTIHQIKIGKLGEDFSSFKDYLNFIKSKKYYDIYSKLRGIPAESCLKCKLFANCQGRCVCNWTNYSFVDIQKYKLKDARFLYYNEFDNNFVDKQLVRKIENYKSVQNNKKYRLILGNESYKISGNQTSSHLIYQQYTNGKVAFIEDDLSISKKRIINASMITVLSFLFGAENEIVKIVMYLAQTSQMHCIVDFLNNEGIFLMNFADFSHLNNNAIATLIGNFSCVLICGRNRSVSPAIKTVRKKVYNEIRKQCIPAIEVMHPTSNNYSKPYFFDIWYFHDDSNSICKQITKGKICKLNDFIV